MAKTLIRLLILSTCCVWILIAVTGVAEGEESVTGGSRDGSCNNTGLEYITHEKRLISCLMKDYDPAVRPALSPRDPVKVTLSSVIMTITSLNEKIGVLTTDSWLRQTWVDVQLRWNENDFGDLKEIRLPVEKLWTPQIVLFNNADESFRYVMDKLVIVNSTGHVTWIPHARMRSFCDLDLTMFPYDIQTCRLFLGSWTYEDSLVSLEIPGRQRFLPKTADWEVIDFEVGVISFSDGMKGYPTVVYSIQMKRVSIFYKYVLVAPSVILAFLTLMMFWIPPESNERFMLATGILVSLTLLLVVLEGFLPTDLGKLPIIASYLGFCFALLVITIAVSIVALNCHYRGVRSGSVPSWIRWVFLGCLSRLVCFKVRPYTTPSAFSLDRATEENEAHKELQTILSDHPDGAEGGVTPLPCSPTMAIEKTMDEVRRYLRYLAAKAEQEGHVAPHSELVSNEWQQVALVVDRLMFCVFLLISILTTIIIFCHKS